jgi:hypothetical protein
LRIKRPVVKCRETLFFFQGAQQQQLTFIFLFPRLFPELSRWDATVLFSPGMDRENGWGKRGKRAKKQIHIQVYKKKTLKR